MGDDEILQLFYHRVEYAISAVEEKYGRLCRSVARGILKDERDVEECVNDTCMRAWNAIPPEKPRSLEAYLVRITRNLALDRYAYHHSQKRETALTEAYEELEACLPLAKDGPEEAAMVQELQRTLNDFLRAQPEDARRFFLRRYWYGESIAEIAEACGAGTSGFRLQPRPACASPPRWLPCRCCALRPGRMCSRTARRSSPARAQRRQLYPPPSQPMQRRSWTSAIRWPSRRIRRTWSILWSRRIPTFPWRRYAM